MKEKKRNVHRPLHLDLKDEIYFLTGSVYSEDSVFIDNSNKDIFLNVLLEQVKLLGYKIFAFAILNNHYHILLQTSYVNISDFVGRLHGKVSYIINKKEKRVGRKIFYQYWDWCIRNEKDFYIHFNYTHINSIKHGLIEDFEQLVNYKYCSFGSWLKKEGREFVFDCLAQYPVRDFEVKGD